MVKFTDENTFYITVITLLALVIIFAAILPVWWQNQRMSHEVSQLAAKIKILQQQKAMYQRKIDALKNNPAYVEFLLRTKLYFGRKGEISCYQGNVQ